MRGKTIALLAVLLVLGVVGGFAVGSWFLKQEKAVAPPPADPAAPAVGKTPAAGASTVRIVRVAPRGDGVETPRVEVELDAVPADPKAVEAGFSMLPRLAGTITWQDKTLIFQPSQAFQPGYLYTARLESPGVIPGVDGLLIDGKATEWSFLVAGAPVADITGVEYYGAGYQLVRVDDGGRRDVLGPLPGDKSLGDPVWSPTGDRLLFQSGFLFSLGLDNPQDVQRVAGFEQGTPDDYHASWAPSGRSVVLQHNGVLYTQSLSGGESKVLPGSYSGQIYPEWSPVGGRIAVLDRSPQGGVGALWVMTQTGGSRQKIAGDVSGFAWSPDGRVVAYLRGAGDAAELHMYDVGAARDERIAKAPGGLLAWSPDGARLAVLSGDVLWTMGTDGRSLAPIARGVRDTASSFAWSGTGAYLAYVDKSGHLWRIRADGDGAVQVTRGQEQWMLPRWADR